MPNDSFVDLRGALLFNTDIKKIRGSDWKKGVSSLLLIEMFLISFHFVFS